MLSTIKALEDISVSGFMKVFIRTFGCQMNEAESDYLSSAITDSLGFDLADSPSDADFIICNTCSVRQSAEERAEGFISQTKGESKNSSKIILTGCMASDSNEDLKIRFPYVDYFVRNNDKDRIVDILAAESEGREPCYDKSDSYEFKENYRNRNGCFSFVPIQNGCNNFCSYCVVPYTRGREGSRDFPQIIDEISMLDKSGVRVVTLLGQNVNSYRCGSRRFKDLVGAIGGIRFQNIKWIYFDSPHIKDFNSELFDMLASSDVFAKSFHVPVQSFSTSVLKSMNRHETQDDIYAFFDLAKRKMPDASFTTDIMVGFPTETENDFHATLDGVRKVSFIDAFMYYYNPRKGTVAYSAYRDLDLNLKKARLMKLIDLQGGISLNVRKSMLGREFDIVACKKSRKDDSKVLCYTEGNCAVLADEGKISCGQVGRFVLKELVGRTFLA